MKQYQHFNQATVTTQSCDEDWEQGNWGGQTIFCARPRSGISCAGDSGGPAVADMNGDGIWVLYGVVSYSYWIGERCSGTYKNGYAKVENHANLIKLYGMM